MATSIVAKCLIIAVNFSFNEVLLEVKAACVEFKLKLVEGRKRKMCECGFWAILWMQILTERLNMTVGKPLKVLIELYKTSVIRMF